MLSIWTHCCLYVHNGLALSLRKHCCLSVHIIFNVVFTYTLLFVCTHSVKCCLYIHTAVYMCNVVGFWLHHLYNLTTTSCTQLHLLWGTEQQNNQPFLMLLRKAIIQRILLQSQKSMADQSWDSRSFFMINYFVWPCNKSYSSSLNDIETYTNFLKIPWIRLCRLC